ncbi:MAG: right-handed parallel beta-helix repeat-containing protein [Actinomycetota bacterium]|nr:right-handed parallel beta-helix repeat-containing protein [Actinomycetota bacterium]
MRRLSGFMALTMVAGFLALAAPANASVTFWVHHGQSIQAAINAAHHGDRIVVTHGVYREALQLRKDDITLEGHHAVIVPPEHAPNRLCTQFGLSGICVLAKEVDPTTGVVEAPVSGDHISGFTIRGFDGFGIMTYGSQWTVIRHNRAFNNADYGITSFNSSHNSFIDNVATGASEAGFYFGDSPQADAVIHGNVSHDNQFGFFIRDASHGVIRDNRSYENCIGTLFLAGAPGPASDWTYTHNRVWDNDKACPANPDEGSPPLSGIGVLLAGSDHVRVVRNWIARNHPGGPTPAAAGIAVITSIAAPFAPVDNLVKHNVILHNSPLDVIYDGTGSGNRFVDNLCATSTPAGICH